MNAITDILNIMSSEDLSAFSKYLNSKNKRKDTLNTTLLKMLKTDDIKLNEKLYGTKNNAAYHALRKRLYSSLIEFMANRSFENNTGEEHEIMRLLMVSKVLFEHKLYKEAFKCLAKAEAKAVKLEHFALLNDIYQTQLQYAHFDKDFDLETAISKSSANRNKLYNEEQLNLAYAVMRKELADIYHNGKITDIQQLITDTLIKFGISLKDVLTFKSLYQMLFIANEYASINSDYSLIEPFAKQGYKFISVREELTEKHLYYHIYILYFIANIHFRNKRFDQCTEYLDGMAAQMQKQNKKYYSRFAAKYLLLKSLNENYSGAPGLAEGTIRKALAESEKYDPADKHDLLLFAIVFRIQHNDTREAAKLMRSFSHTDSWYEKKMGMEWGIKRSLVEILLHAQLENTELALSRIKSFKRRYKKYLTNVKEERVLDYLHLVEKYIIAPENAASKTYRKQLDNLIISSSHSNADIFVLSFIGWLVAAVYKKPVYGTILDMVKGYFSPFHSA